MTMNKYLILTIFLLSLQTANAKKVQFAVDMTGQTVSPNGIHVAGDFQDEAGFEGGDWQSNTTLMTKEEGTEIYSVMVDIPAFAKYEYKYINGDQWYEVEFVPQESRVGYDYNDNRWIYVDSVENDTMIIPPVLFSGNAPAGFHLLRLTVDMSQVDFIDPAGIHLAINEELGTGLSSVMYSFVENVYEKIVYAEMWTDYSDCYYIFINGNNLQGYETVPPECAQGGYRFVEISKDTVMETVCFSACTACDPQGLPQLIAENHARIIPNPMKSQAILEFNDDLPFHEVSLIDITGKTVMIHPDCTEASFILRRESLHEGIYFLRISSGNTWLSTLKLIITQ